MSLWLAVPLAVALGVAWVLLTQRSRSRRPLPLPDSEARNPLEQVLKAYRAGRYQEVNAGAPAVLAELGTDADDPLATRWRARIQLVYGHSLFQEDRFADAVPQLEAGLAAADAARGDGPPLEGESRFRHCLGYAYQATGRTEQARAVYEDLLADEDLDPTVRDGVAKHLTTLDESAD